MQLRTRISYLNTSTKKLLMNKIKEKIMTFKELLNSVSFEEVAPCLAFCRCTQKQRVI